MNEQEITIADLLARIAQAQQRMGRKNTHRDLLEQCKVAITYLAQQHGGEVRTPGGIILP